MYCMRSTSFECYVCILMVCYVIKCLKYVIELPRKGIRAVLIFGFLFVLEENLQNYISWLTLSTV